MMTSSEIRESFLSYFQEQGHKRVESSSLVPAEDPTLLFTNAGMNQFKLVFTGVERRDYRRAASSQRCVRAGGKHNDLENVGYTARHHTFFEMLGNFSFGDYFKEGAIEFAYTLLVHKWKLDPTRMIFTIFSGFSGFSGSSGEGSVPADDEARAAWKRIAGVGDDRVIGLGMSDNFWAMGDTGPCGPCSEIHYHLGDDIPCAEESAGRKCRGVACDCDRWMEIWNLVFMQYNRTSDGKLIPLPAPSIDTGMGLERVTAVIQGKRSNYDTDLFQKIIGAACERLGTHYGHYGDSETMDVSLRVIADHLRASAFLIADGIYPSNEGRGYVLRRIMRRMIRHTRLLGAREPIAYTLTPVLIELMGKAHPILEERATVITQAIRREEETFLVALDRGIALLDETIASLPGKVIPGAVTFKLYDTFGFPPDLTAVIARDRGLSVDQEGFDVEMAAQRDRSRKASSFAAGVELDAEAKIEPTEFTGYDELTTEASVLAVIPAPENRHRIVLDRTTFYAESGGQIGDRGVISSNAATFRVEKTEKNARGVYFHLGVFEGTSSLREGVAVRASVDHVARVATERNHTATHLLHAALRTILGDHVRQAGSLVSPDRLRFDFAHFQAMTADELERVEKIANDGVLADLDVTKKIYPIEDAKKMGAMMFFGDKYGELVRVISIEGCRAYEESGVETASREFCGGTHVRRSGEIGLIKIVTESAVAAGVRRLEAVTGVVALASVEKQERVLASACERIAAQPADLEDRITRLLDERKKLLKELARSRTDLALTRASEIIADAENIGGIPVVASFFSNIDKTTLRTVADKLLKSLGSGVIILGSDPADDDGNRKAALCVVVSEDLISRIKAGEIVGPLARICGGGGGGKPTSAEAGGRDGAKVPEAIKAAPDVVRTLLENARN